MKLSTSVLALVVVGCFTVNAQAKYSQKLKCVSIKGPSVNYGQTTSEIVTNVVDDTSNPVWQVLGTFGPSSAFPVIATSSNSMIGEHMLLAEREVTFVEKPTFVVSGEDALIKTAIFHIKGKLKTDLRASIASMAKGAASDGYSSADLAELKKNIGQAIDQAESTAADSELECSIEGVFSN